MIIAFISIVAIVVLQSFGVKVTELFTFINQRVDMANSASF